MKKITLLFLLFVFSISNAQNFTDTKGELQISNGGQATYNIPIATPPSIKNVAPIINLTYSSGVRGGIAGQGWSINSISSISRMATRNDIDGFRDGVDFDNNDKLALDGQRLLLKTGSYWSKCSTYETEYKSNTRIELKFTTDSDHKTYFVVTSPDGSRSWYGSDGTGNNQYATSVNSWYIVRHEDVYGNYITYNYTNVTYNNTNQLYIHDIKFSGNEGQGIAQLNQILFNYGDAKRVERDYIKGAPVYASKILDSVVVKTNDNLFRTYKLTHYADDLGYQRVYQIQEFNAQNEPSNPVKFEYYSTPTTTTKYEKEYVNNLNFSEVDLSGDFDGDGRLDFVSGNQVFTNLFNSSSGNTPFTLPFSANARQKFVATTLSEAGMYSSNTAYKLNQKQSIVHAEEGTHWISFNVYNQNPTVAPYLQGFSLNYMKTIDFDNSFYHDSTLDAYVDKTGTNPIYPGICNNNPLQKDSNEYLEGDFNGDGIGEVLIKSTTNERWYNSSWADWQTDSNYIDGEFIDTSTLIYNCDLKIKSDANEYYLLNLDPRASTTLGDSGYVKLLNDAVLQGDKRYVIDFNSDGKADILVVKNDKTYKIVSFKQLLQAPWIELEVLGQGILDDYSPTKQILFGDYNGDGKTDIMLPTSEGCRGCTGWNIYYSNPKPEGGEFFVKEYHDIVEYWPNSTIQDPGYFVSQAQFNNFYAVDINGDGKSDLVRVWRRYYKPTSHWWDPGTWTINDHDTEWRVEAYSNTIGKIGAEGFTQTYNSGDFYSGSPDIPIPLASNYKYSGANTDLVIVRGQNNKVEYYQFNKDLDTDNRLNTVTESNGNIKHLIIYHKMQSNDSSLGNPTTDIYSSKEGSIYPDIEIIKNPNSFLVSKLTATINGISKSQDFKYHGYVSNFNYGTVGFKRTARSSWYTSTFNTKIWTIQNNDPSLRGANTITWTNTNGASVFASLPDNLLSTKTNVFATYTNPTTKVYNVLLSQQTTIDEYTNVKIEDNFTYDGTVSSASYYGLQTKKETNYYNGTVLQGTSTTITDAGDYESNPTSVGNAYFIGRPKKVSTSTTIYKNTDKEDTRTSEEKYTYTGFNLTKTEKKGTNTDYLVEEMTYDLVGNLLTKTVSMPTANPTIAPRTIIDEYEPTKRFVTKKTDHQLFVTNLEYNPLGQVTKSTNYLGVVSEFTFDNWGKLIQSKTTGAATTQLISDLSYAKLSDGGYTVTSINTAGDNAMSITQYDVLGRVVKTTTKGFAANSLISKSIEYDALGRKLRESEPYFSSPSLWTTYQYDYLHRPTQVTASTGRIQTIDYSGGLTTKSVDDGKTTTTTVDALGNKVQTTDPGGAIDFTYYANGQLKKNNYEGHEVKIEIDGWGNKTATFDPNAGNYTYSYDAFGQIKTETTPKGSTSYTYDDFGKILTKKMFGDGADYNTVYTYNSLAQLTNETSKTSAGVLIDTYDYGYDGLHRLTTTTEETTSLKHIKTLSFDTLGRLATETHFTQEKLSGTNLASTVLSKYWYNSYNGILYKITDQNDALLWQLNTVNEKMQTLTAALGNGINITNTYSDNSYFTSQTHSKNGIDVLNNTYDFNPVQGNLMSRTNNIFDIQEYFDYDPLDRLNSWTSGSIDPIQNCAFDTGLENCTPLGSSLLTNENGKLKVIVNEVNTGVLKQIVTGASAGESLKITFEELGITSCCTSSNPSCCSNSILMINVYEKDPLTQVITNIFYQAVDVGNNVIFYQTANNNSDVYIKFYINQYSSYNNTQLTFTLDNLKVGKEIINTQYQNYDTKGRITDNELGAYNYNTDLTTGIYRKSTINLSPEGNTYYNALGGNQEVSYTMFKSPITINESNKGIMNFEYNSHLSRSKMSYDYGTIAPSTDKESRKFKAYSDDGSTEVLFDKATNTVRIRTFIGGDAYNAVVYNEKLYAINDGTTTDNNYYLHRDYLGSILAITNNDGVAVEKRHFDAWGNLAKIVDSNNVSLDVANGLQFFDRGYTSHEHLQEVHLINMNGRLYDPVLRSFLMPDNFIQQPENTQNYNRYAYGLNNPLKYTDPSGEFIFVAIAIGAFIAAATYTLTAALSDVPFSVGGLCQATFIGAASAAVTFGIGTAAGNLFANFYSQAAFQAVAHGTFQGAMTAISGGKFWSGFAAGALSSIASSLYSGGSSMDGLGKGAHAIPNSGFNSIGDNLGDAGMIAFGTIAGGAGAALTGGNFWQGAATGLVVSGLNHFAHQIQEKQTVRGVLKRLLLDGGDKAPKTYASLRLLLSDPAVNSQYIMGGSPTVGDGGQLSIGEGDYTVTNGERADATTDIFGNGDTVMYGNSFKNWETLAYNTVHELTHRFQWSMGYINKWSNQFGGRRDVVWNMAEYDARSNIIGWGFNPPAGYVSSHKSYVNSQFPNTIK
jgi:RHS repeat-associated protein